MKLAFGLSARLAGWGRVQLPQHSTVREHGVEFRQFFHGDFATTKRKRQAIKGFGLQATDTGTAEELVQIRLTDLHRGPYGGHVTTTDQGVLCADRAEKTTVEILRRERPKRRGRIAQDGLRMEHTLVQSKAVDERLQSGTRRALRKNAVHLSLNRIVAVVGRPHPGFHGHIGRIYEKRGGIVDATFAELFQIAMDLPLHQTLEAGVERGIDTTARVAILAEQRIYKVRRFVRHRIARVGDHRQFELATLGIGRRNHLGCKLRPRLQEAAFPNICRGLWTGSR